MSQGEWTDWFGSGIFLKSNSCHAKVNILRAILFIFCHVHKVPVAFELMAASFLMCIHSYTLVGQVPSRHGNTGDTSSFHSAPKSSGVDLIVFFFHNSKVVCAVVLWDPWTPSSHHLFDCLTVAKETLAQVFQALDLTTTFRSNMRVAVASRWPSCWIWVKLPLTLSAVTQQLVLKLKPVIASHSSDSNRSLRQASLARVSLSWGACDAAATPLQRHDLTFDHEGVFRVTNLCDHWQCVDIRERYWYWNDLDSQTLVYWVNDPCIAVGNPGDVETQAFCACDAVNRGVRMDLVIKQQFIGGG